MLLLMSLPPAIVISLIAAAEVYATLITPPDASAISPYRCRDMPRHATPLRADALMPCAPALRYRQATRCFDMMS